MFEDEVFDLFVDYVNGDVCYVLNCLELMLDMVEIIVKGKLFNKFLLIEILGE